MPEVTLLNTVAPRKGGDVIREGLEEHRSHDLVIGVVAQVGSGPSKVATQIHEQLRAKNYTSHWLQLSRVMSKAAVRQGMAQASILALEGVDRAETLQNVGDDLRREYGASIVASLGIAELARLREEKGGRPEGRGTVAIFDSLKHPAEVEMLRSVYGNAFYLVGVVCGAEHRTERLTLKFNGSPAESIRRLAANDDLGAGEHGQQVRKTLHLSDYFVNNEGKIGDLANIVRRLTEVLTGDDCFGPTRDEEGMYAAFGASLRSACLSRQVGAAIMGGDGKLLSTGRNDVPVAGGGLYGADIRDDHRCFQREDGGHIGFCSNDFQKKLLVMEVQRQLSNAGLLVHGADLAGVEAALMRTRVRDLIEFSRAVHAEMDAITSIARVGGGSTRDATLYSTTYPCHNCARHIVASGVSEVVYIEPYAKSLATTLHDDSIVETTAPGKVKGKVCFRLFTGVAPRRYSRLFEMREPRKDAQGRLIKVRPGTAQHCDSVLTKGFEDLERRVAESVKDLMSGNGDE